MSKPAPKRAVDAEAADATVGSELSTHAEAAGSGAFRRSVAPPEGRVFAYFLAIDFCLRDGAGSERAATRVTESSDNSEEEDEETNTNLEEVDFFARAANSECIGFIAETTDFECSGSAAEANEL